MDIVLFIVAAVGVAAILAAVSVFVIRKIKFSRLPPEVRESILRARDARDAYRRARKITSIVCREPRLSYTSLRTPRGNT